MLNQGELLPYRDQFKVSSRAKKSNRFTPCHTCRLLTGCPSQASDPSRCDAPHRTPPATLSSFQVPQGTQHSSLFAFCTFCSPGSNALFLTPRYPSVSALTSLSQVRLTLCRTEPHGFFQENMTHPHWYLFSICPPCWAGGTDVLCLLGRRNPAQGLGRSRCSNIC